MKALSIRQPWAWAILNAGKRVENRSWQACHYRGPLLIHAAKGCGVEEYADAAMWMHEQHLATPIEWRLDRQHVDTPKLQALATLPRGGIVGVCSVVGSIEGDPGGHIFAVTEARCRACGSEERRGHCPKSDPWFVGPIGIVLDNVRPLPFVPFKGALGFFDVPGATPEDVVNIARREGRVST